MDAQIVNKIHIMLYSISGGRVLKNLCVQGGRKLYGSVRVQGSKNICLPVMAASILNEGISVIENCPCIDGYIIMQETFPVLDV